MHERVHRILLQGFELLPPFHSYQLCDLVCNNLIAIMAQLWNIIFLHQFLMHAYNALFFGNVNVVLQIVFQLQA